jgi:hypothetical protein
MWDMMRLGSASAFLSPECNALKLLDERPSPSYDPLGDKYPAGSVVAVDTGGLLLAVVVTTALQDRGGAFGITAALREALFTITLVWAGAGYTGRFVRNARKIWAWPWRSSSAPTGPRACPAPPPLGRGRLLRLADQVPPTRTHFETVPATHEAMIWTAALSSSAAASPADPVHRRSLRGTRSRGPGDQQPCANPRRGWRLRGVRARRRDRS